MRPCNNNNCRPRKIEKTPHKSQPFFRPEVIVVTEALFVIMSEMILGVAVFIACYNTLIGKHNHFTLNKYCSHPGSSIINIFHTNHNTMSKITMAATVDIIFEHTTYTLSEEAIKRCSKPFTDMLSSGFKEGETQTLTFRADEYFVGGDQVARCVHWLNHGEYSVDGATHFSGTGIWLLAHAEMYAFACLYDIPKLRLLALKNFDKGSKHLYHESDFRYEGLEIASVVYSTTTEEDNFIRRAVKDMIEPNITIALMDQGLKALRREFEDLDKDILDLACDAVYERDELREKMESLSEIMGKGKEMADKKFGEGRWDGQWSTLMDYLPWRS